MSRQMYQIDALVDSFADLARFDKNGKVRIIPTASR